MSQAQNISIFSEFLDALDDFNKRFFRTVKGLVLDPKLVIDTMLPDNHNRQYVNPFRFALLIFSFHTFCMALLELNMANIGHVLTGDENTEELALTFHVFDNATIFLSFVYLIPCAMLMTKLFSKPGISSFACYKIALYGSALSNLLSLVIIVPAKLLVLDMSDQGIASLIQITPVLTSLVVIRIYMVYFCTAYWEGLWKSVVVLVFSNVIAVLLVALLTISVGIYEGNNESTAEKLVAEQAAISEQTKPEQTTDKASPTETTEANAIRAIEAKETDENQ